MINHISKRFHLVGYVIGIMVLLALGYFILSKVHIVANLMAISILLAYLIAPGVNALHSRGVSKILAISLVYLISATIIGFFMAYLMPVVNVEFHRLLHNIASLSGNLDHIIFTTVSKIHQMVPEGFKSSFEPEQYRIEELASRMPTDLPTILSGSLPGVFTGVKSAAGLITGTILVPLLTFYILMDADKYKKGFLGVLPKTWRLNAAELLFRVDYTLGRYIRGQIIVCISIGFSVALALYLLGIDYAILIGFFAGVIDIIPYVGVVIGLVPAFLIALINHGILYALFTIAVLECIHWLEGHIIVPAVVGNSVGLPPLTVMVALLAGAELGGIMGMLVSIPLAAIGRVIIEFYVEKHSGFGALTDEDMDISQKVYPKPAQPLPSIKDNVLVAKVLEASRKRKERRASAEEMKAIDNTEPESQIKNK